MVTSQEQLGFASPIQVLSQVQFQPLCTRVYGQQIRFIQHSQSYSELLQPVVGKLKPLGGKTGHFTSLFAKFSPWQVGCWEQPWLPWDSDGRRQRGPQCHLMASLAAWIQNRNWLQPVQLKPRRGFWGSRSSVVCSAHFFASSDNEETWAILSIYIFFGQDLWFAYVHPADSPNISKYAEMCCPLCDSSYMIWTLLVKCLDIDSCTTLAIPVRQPGNPNKPPFSFRAWINKVSSSSLQQQPWWLTSWAIVEEGSPLVWLFFFLRSTLVCLAAASNNLTFAFVQSPSQTLLMLFER